MKGLYSEKLTSDDLAITPKRFDNDADGHSVVYCVESIAEICDQGIDKPPLTMFRHGMVNQTRWAGIVRTSEDPYGIQTPVHVLDLANCNDEVEPYHMISNNPVIYEFKTKSNKNPCFKKQIATDYTIWQEGENGSILNVRGEPFPVACFSHLMPETFNASTVVSQAYTFSGTYEGKPISFVGVNCNQSIPRSDKSAEEQEKEYQKTTSYLGATLVGVREDGRRETAWMYGGIGHTIGGYWIDGEEPINCHVKFIGDFIHKPGMTDGTCIAKNFDLIFEEGDIKKVVHFEGKWGLKGWGINTDEDKLVPGGPTFGIRHGQSQISGTWYEGDSPYKHVLKFTFIENMDCYDKDLIAAGYNVID